ncbi:MAG: anaerobic benzoate catabolism transcriptional regulator [Alphaproteobacteria bacterium ADurb.Bin438]|nr:MAG: anaerobic benzoate catabolism transcriptional regulator [Alphaproteobacteria bacterium ADurb.Bin438]
MKINMKQSIGLRIKATRQIRKMTQEKLAEKCGISTESISNIERGVNFPAFETLGSIAMALSCPMTDLIDVFPKDISRQRALLESEAIAILRSLPEDKLVMAAKMIIALK